MSKEFLCPRHEESLGNGVARGGVKGVNPDCLAAIGEVADGLAADRYRCHDKTTESSQEGEAETSKCDKTEPKSAVGQQAERESAKRQHTHCDPADRHYPLRYTADRN